MSIIRYWEFDILVFMGLGRSQRESRAWSNGAREQAWTCHGHEKKVYNDCQLNEKNWSLEWTVTLKNRGDLKEVHSKLTNRRQVWTPQQFIR